MKFLKDMKKFETPGTLHFQSPSCKRAWTPFQGVEACTKSKPTDRHLRGVLFRKVYTESLPRYSRWLICHEFCSLLQRTEPLSAPICSKDDERIRILTFFEIFGNFWKLEYEPLLTHKQLVWDKNSIISNQIFRTIWNHWLVLII